MTAPRQQQSPAVSPNRWFAQRRDFFVKNVFEGFYKNRTFFIGLYDRYNNTGQISFSDIAELVGVENHKGLWLVKDRCHQLWRDGESRFDNNGFFLDWVVGSLFHEAVKLKENIYMFHFYAPQADEIKQQFKNEIMGSDAACLRFMEGTEAEIRKQMDNLALLFGRANYLLRSMLVSQSGNVLLIRYLIERKDVVQELWSESLEELFDDMFPGGPEQGFCMAGKNYLDGHWHDRALMAYSAALEINPKCDDALRRISQIKITLRHKEEVEQAELN
jgi:hypothetical protein